ncbi:MBL fold metallo-hydrolase [Cellulomonas taurus]|uniref:MBL fold metallo-hydrolase n=1 Tax=Cellulomonas taurus TaxID=2729175 RepID=UPI00145EC085|nr:MBL fold metallo-hydrolase [Cellulomonas taurus]
MTHPLAVRETAPGLFTARTPLVNWLLAVDGDAVLLIDSGYPGQCDALVESLRMIGRRPEDVVAGIATHGHVDHIGGFTHLRTGLDFPVYGLAAELPNLRREVVHQADLRAIAPSLWQPRVARWAVAAMSAGGLRDVAIPDAAEAPADQPLDLPLRPVLRAVPGHTPGSAVVHFPELGVLATGDAAVTGHPTLRPPARPGLIDLPAYFQHDPDVARSGRELLCSWDAGIVIPGHGPVIRRS